MASRFPDVEIPELSVPQFVLAGAAERADRPALIDGLTGETMTHGQLAAHVDRLAAALQARGLGKGDVVAVFSPNTIWYPVVFHGIAAAGCVVSPVNALYTPEEIAFQLRDSGAKMLVTVSPFLDRALTAVQKSPVAEVIVLDGAEGHASLRDLLGTDAPAARVDIEPATDLVTLPYSSGTTGLPKGVMLTHANLVTTVRQMDRGLRLTRRDTVLAVAPFFHVMGFMATLALPLASGATVVTMPRFDLEGFLTLVQRHRATVLVVPPPVMATLAGHPLVDACDLSSVELIVSGGAPLGADLQRAVAARVPGAAVRQGWGLTETSIGVTLPDRRAGTVPGSVGRVMPNTELRVVDPLTGRDLGAGEPGELWARGPQVMAGYLGRPDATAEILDADGWLHTGDLGYVDADGNVFVVDRLKELIKVSAYQVAPAELEALLAGHPAVADAAVVPRPDATHGEVPVAVVVPRGEVDADELIAWVAERVAPHKRVRAVRLVDAIPRTPSGKLLRRVLIAQDRQRV